ncbi:MAG: hypothetical protein ACMXYM_04630 [Candidatus Woesearchaeota archaeon]
MECDDGRSRCVHSSPTAVRIRITFSSVSIYYPEGAREIRMR